MDGRGKKETYPKFQSEILEEADHLKDPDLGPYRKIILKLMLKNMLAFNLFTII
jgi:hypothetical protein